jgi:hypothetical protein
MRVHAFNSLHYTRDEASYDTYQTVSRTYIPTLVLLILSCWSSHLTMGNSLVEYRARVGIFNCLVGCGRTRPTRCSLATIYSKRLSAVFLFWNAYIIIIIICDTYKALPRTHAVKALLPIRFCTGVNCCTCTCFIRRCRTEPGVMYIITPYMQMTGEAMENGGSPFFLTSRAFSA